MADRTDYAAYENARAEIMASYDQLLRTGDRIKAVVDSTGPVRPWFSWAESAYKVLTNLATMGIVKLSDDDWNFPELASRDMANWSAIRNHYRMTVDLVDWMERLGSDEASRARLATAGAADALRADVDGALNARLARLNDPAYWSKLQAQPVQPNGMRPLAAPIPLPGYGLHVPTLPNASRNRDGSPWAGLTGDSYKTVFPGQLGAAQFMADFANDAVTMLRTTRGSFNDLFASLKMWMLSAVAVLVALLIALSALWATIVANITVFLAVAGILGVAVSVAGALWAHRITILMATLASLSLDKIMGISQSWVAINKNLDTLAAAVESFGEVLNEKLTAPVGFVDGRWPDPTRVAEFPNMGRAPSGAWAPVTNNYFDRRSGTVPPDPRAPR